MSPSRICTAFSYSNIILSESKKEALTSREEKEACWRKEITWEIPSLGASVPRGGGDGGAVLCCHLRGQGTHALCLLSFKTLTVLALSQLNKCLFAHSKARMLVKATDQCEFKMHLK